MTFQGTRGAKHSAQPWKKSHFLPILDLFQNDEVFHASQIQHNWTKAWCEYLDYIRTIDITHNASPEQLERYAALYHFRYHPKNMEKGPMKSRPDNDETTRATVSITNVAMIWTQRRSIVLRGDSTQRHHRESEKEHASGNREALTHTSND